METTEIARIQSACEQIAKVEGPTAMLDVAKMLRESIDVYWERIHKGGSWRQEDDDYIGELQDRCCKIECALHSLGLQIDYKPIQSSESELTDCSHMIGEWFEITHDYVGIPSGTLVKTVEKKSRFNFQEMRTKYANKTKSLVWARVDGTTTDVTIPVSILIPVDLIDARDEDRETRAKQLEGMFQ